MVKTSGLLVAFVVAAMLVSASEGIGDWMGYLFINGDTTPANADGIPICIYLGASGTASDRAVVGEDTSGYYLLHAYGATGQTVSFRVFCEYAVNENPQAFTPSPPTNELNLTINHTSAPVITIISPIGSSVTPGTKTLMVTTDESATCRYSRTAGTEYDAMTSTTSALGTTHSWSISAPSYSTTYNYYVKCRDQFGYTSSDANVRFTTVSGGGGVGGGIGGGGGSSGGGSIGPTPTPRPGQTPTQPGCNPLGGACSSAGDCCDAGAVCQDYVCRMPQSPTPTPSVQPLVNLTVPGTLTVNSVAEIRAVDGVTGLPLAGITITITSPSGETITVTTNSAGLATFIPQEVGVYGYAVPGFRQGKPASSNVQPLPATPGPVTPTPTPARRTPTPTPSGGWMQPLAMGVGALAVIAVALVVVAGAVILYRRSRRRGL